VPAETNAELLELVERAQRGEAIGGVDVRDEIVRRTQPALLRYLMNKTRTYRRVPGEDDLKDIAQEAYADVFRSLRTFRPELATFQSWLCSIALRQSFKWLKRAVRDQGAGSLDDRPEDGEAPYPEPSSGGHILIEQQLILKDLLRFMAEAVLNINNREYRLVVGMLFFGWYSLSEVREILGWNPNTLKSAFRRGFAEVLARVSMRAGPTYAQMAEGLITTYKKPTLAKGMSVLDVEAVGRIADPMTREFMRRLLVEGRTAAQAAQSLGLGTADAEAHLYEGVTALVRFIGEG
jgi:RNA polymerase sigma factor (sigma-70 family)